MSADIDATRALLATLAAGGIGFATAFPGSPTTALAQLLEREGDQVGIEFRWAINENVALSQAFGAAMAGRGAVAIMKHVGVNVAADALQAMGVVHGLAAPLILIEGADARPGSSQSAQDNRSLYAGSPQLLAVAPTSPAEIVELVGEAITIARAAGMIVVVRGDHRCFSGEGPASLPGARERRVAHSPWPERGRALATTARTYAHHLEQRRRVFEQLEPWLRGCVRAWGDEGACELAVVVAGHLGLEAAEAARARGLAGVRLLIEHPLPEQAIVELARRSRELVVLEECTPTLEGRVRALLQEVGLMTPVLGRRALGDLRPVGRLSGEALERVLEAARARAGASAEPIVDEWGPARVDLDALLVDLPERLSRSEDELEQNHPLSGFPASDPRRALFEELRELPGIVSRACSFIATDPGITGVLALAEHRADVKMHMGGAVPLAAGWARARPEGLAIAVVGDTNLPHSEWLGLLDAVDHADDLLIVIADNGSSEMTQRIVTPRIPRDAALASFAAIGMRCFSARVTTDRSDPWATALRGAAASSGPRLIWMSLPNA